MTGLWALVAALLVTAVLAVLLRLREGRIKVARRAGRDAPAVLTNDARTDAGTESGASAGAELPVEVRELLDSPSGAVPVTLVQLTTTFCVSCRPAREVLSALSSSTDGLRHVELDLTDRPDLAARLGVLRAPTTLAYDPSGTELLRVGGVPKPDTLLDALRPHLPA